MANIIIKRPDRYGRTRSEQESNLRKDGMRSLSDEQFDKLKYIERRLRDTTGSTHNYVGQEAIGVAPEAAPED